MNIEAIAASAVAESRKLGTVSSEFGPGTTELAAEFVRAVLAVTSASGEAVLISVIAGGDGGSVVYLDVGE